MEPQAAAEQRTGLINYMLIGLLFLLFSSAAVAQQKYTISGYVRDATNGESLLAANVYIKEAMQGTTTNEYGFYSITYPEGEYTLVASFIGYQEVEKTIVLDKDMKINFELGFNEVVADEVVVTAKRKDENVQSTDVGKVELKTSEIKSMPALMGEVDVMKTMQLLPGVLSAGEGNAGLYVRGGGPAQNLILLDQAVVYNPGHLFGFFSVFNADAVKSTTLIKGGVPANYGGRISAVLDVKMKEGNIKEWEVEGGLGLISSRLTVQGPIKKDKASIIVSARRTYADLLLRPVLKRVADGDFAGNIYYFFDINAKFNYKFSDKDRLFVSGYFGRDVFEYNDPNGTFNARIPWGNATATVRWNHLFSDKLFMNTIFIYNDYNFEVTSDFQNISFGLSSGVRDASAEMAFDWFASPKHKVKFGAQYTYHIFTPYSISGFAGDTDIETDNLTNKYAHEGAIYITDEWEISRRIKVNVGLRGSMFSHVGPLYKVSFDEFGSPEDTLDIPRGEGIETYFGLEPRANMRLLIDERSSIKAGVTLSNQYIHLVSSSTTTLPTDLWVPSTGIVKPQIGVQYSLGYFRNFADNMFETSIEVYYKDMRNQIEFGESSTLELNQDIDDSFVFGRGRSTGVEFFVKKAQGKFNGWIGYTLSWTWRKFPDLNQGEVYWAKFDRRHDLSVVLVYNINEKWNISTTFVYGTGQATTVPVGRYFVEGQVVNQYGERNGYRLRPYHRLDLAATWVMVKRKHYHDLSFSIYNVYNRQNPYFIYFDVEGNTADGSLDVSAKQVSLFPVLPSITWNFKF